MNVTVKGGTMTDSEAAAYWEIYEKKAQAEGRELQSVTIELDNDDPDWVDVCWVLKPIKFERLRRITGYLVGTLDRWNDAKHAEERDRVKHGY